MARQHVSLLSLLLLLGACGEPEPGRPGPGSFTLSLPPERLLLVEGGAAQVPVSLIRTGGFEGQVTVRVSTPGFTGQAFMLASDTSAEVSLTATPEAPLGESTVTFSAEAVGVEAKQGTLPVFVRGAPLALDRRVGGKGWVTLDYASFDATVTAAATQPDGKLVLAGWGISTLEDIVVLRLNPDGTVDTSFGTEGRVTLDVCGGNDRANDVLVQPDGKLVLVGWAETSDAGCTGTLWQNGFIARLGSDGTLDTSFNDGGNVTVWFKSPGGERWTSELAAATLQPNGKLVVTGTRQSDTFPIPIVLRAGTDGSPDTNFGAGGLVELALETRGSTNRALSVALQSDGKVVVGGQSQGAALVVRLTPAGALDESFASDGMLVQRYEVGYQGQARNILVQPDGKLLFTGEGDGAGDALYLARLTPDGALDTGFLTNWESPGHVINGFPAQGTSMNLHLRPDGEVWVVGSDADDFGVWRVQGAGASGTYPYVLLPFDAAEAFADLAPGPDGTLWLVGNQRVTGSAKPRFIVARVWE